MRSLKITAVPAAETSPVRRAAADRTAQRRVAGVGLVLVLVLVLELVEALSDPAARLGGTAR